jgi:hypothetical protein
MLQITTLRLEWDRLRWKLAGWHPRQILCRGRRPGETFQDDLLRVTESGITDSIFAVTFDNDSTNCEVGITDLMNDVRGSVLDSAVPGTKVEHQKQRLDNESDHGNQLSETNSYDHIHHSAAMSTRRGSTMTGMKVERRLLPGVFRRLLFELFHVGSRTEIVENIPVFDRQLRVLIHH